MSASQTSSELQYPEFLLGFHQVGMIDCITGHMIELNIQERAGWGKFGERAFGAAGERGQEGGALGRVREGFKVIFL